MDSSNKGQHQNDPSNLSGVPEPLKKFEDKVNSEIMGVLESEMFNDS